MKKIYLAAPMHSDEDRAFNDKVLKALRTRNNAVSAPQEMGIIANDPNGATEQQKYVIWHRDLSAMVHCDICVACLRKGRGPSEGMLYEMGFVAGQGKLVYLYNESDWVPNLILTHGAIVVSSLDELLTSLDTPVFK